MTLMNGLLLTVLNTVVCLAFPKLLSMMMSRKTKPAVSSQATLTSNNVGTDVPSFPY